MNAGVEFVQGLEIRGRADSVGLGITARQLAEACGWPARDRAELAILVVELATNALRHAGCGTCRLEIEHKEARVIVEDGGPGFPDWVLERHAQSLALEGGRPHRAGGLGAGLDSCARLADTLTLTNRLPSGAKVVAVRRRRHA